MAQMTEMSTKVDLAIDKTRFRNENAATRTQLSLTPLLFSLSSAYILLYLSAIFPLCSLSFNPVMKVRSNPAGR